MSKVKKQHYVPQLYLKGFAHDGTHVCVFDKFTGDRRQAATRDVSEENYFYDPSVNEAAGRDEEGEAEWQPIEKLLGTLESDFGDLFNSLRTRESDYLKRSYGSKIFQSLPFVGRVISTNQQRTLSIFIALQFFRTRAFRQIVIEGYEKGRRAILNLLAPEETTPAFPGLPLTTIDKREARRLHGEFIRDLEFVEDLARGLVRKHYWIYGINRTRKPLYTSDHPIVRQAHVRHPFLGNAGLLSPGVEIALPVSPKSIIILYERSVHRRMRHRHRRIIELHEGHVLYYNSLQTKECFRQVYSPEADFADAIEFCRVFPETCQPGRTRVHVGGVAPSEIK